ncbi:MAG: hypothetical protein Q9208_000733 [Pyrenodesmia sp. 3 TL-2023]
MSSEDSKERRACANTPKKMDEVLLHAIEVSRLRSSPPTGIKTQKATPNIGRRRAPPNLTRRTPGSSHHAHISAIFEDAASAVQHISTPRSLPIPAKKLPLLPTKPSSDETRIQESSNDTDASIPNSLPAAYPEVEPPSSGYGSSTGKKRPNAELAIDEVMYPDLTDLTSSVVRRHFTAVTHTPTCESELRSAIPGIENWLEDVRESSPLDDSPHASLPPTPSPSKIPVASKQDGSTDVLSSNAERSCRLLTRSAPRLISRGCLTSPPKRKKARLSPIKNCSADRDQDFIIYEDETSDDHVELSPSVERYRKGQGPQRQRCKSYWDRDIVPGLKELPNETDKDKDGRRVLGDLPALTKAKGFIDGVENTRFDFSVESRT